MVSASAFNLGRDADLQGEWTVAETIKKKLNVKSISINFGLVKVFWEIAPDMTDIFHTHVI